MCFTKFNFISHATNVMCSHKGDTSHFKHNYIRQAHVVSKITFDVFDIGDVVHVPWFNLQKKCPATDVLFH